MIIVKLSVSLLFVETHETLPCQSILFFYLNGNFVSFLGPFILIQLFEGSAQKDITEDGRVSLLPDIVRAACASVYA